MSVTTTNGKPPAEVLRAQLVTMTPEIANALPSHIKPEKFQRVIMTVVQQQPGLLAADRKTLLASCMKCAADGLIPDGREAALVIFGGAVQYMPMFSGIQKRIRNSGEIASIEAHVIYEHDQFVWRQGTESTLEHTPKFPGERGQPIGAYAVAKFKDGSAPQFEVMDKAAIERVRAVSRSKDKGPWVQWWDEMARKSVFKRLAKWLPMDADVDDLIRRDDEAEAVPHTGPTVEAHAEPAPTASKLDALEAAGEVVEIAAEAEMVADPDTDFAADLVGQMRAAKTLAALKAVSTKDVRAKVAEIGKRNPDLYAQIVQAGENRAREIEHPAPAADDGWPGDNVEMEV